MIDAHFSQKGKRLSKEGDRVEDMAALLFAELFYKQVMAERAQKPAVGKKHDPQRLGSDGSGGKGNSVP